VVQVVELVMEQVRTLVVVQVQVVKVIMEVMEVFLHLMLAAVAVPAL
jgi:hypothetical protein